MIHLIERFTEHLKKGKYNQVTIKSYRDAIFLFYSMHRDLPQHKFNDDLVATYLSQLREKRNYSNDSVIQAGKAIKLYFKIIFEKNLTIKASGEQRDKLPVYLSRNEILQIVEHLKNKKHKAIVCLTYGLGLKLNELLDLKVSDINFVEKTIEVGKKKHYSHRILKLDDTLLEHIDFLRDTTKNDEYLLSGNGNARYSPRGVQLFFNRTLQELGLEKEASIQSLRHSYAIHLLERGLDIHHLQKLLGHKFLQTTSIYLEMVDFKTENVESPIGALF